MGAVILNSFFLRRGIATDNPRLLTKRVSVKKGVTKFPVYCKETKRGNVGCIMSLSDEVAVTKHLMKQWLGGGKVSLCEVQKLHVHVIVCFSGSL